MADAFWNGRFSPVALLGIPLMAVLWLFVRFFPGPSDQ